MCKFAVGLGYALLVLCLLADAEGLVLAQGDGSTNISPPEDDPGWAFVGRLLRGESGLATGIYLGNRWVLSMGHMGRWDRIELDGEVYLAQEGSQKHVSRRDGGRSDLMLTRLTQAPPREPAFRIPDAGLEIGEPVLVIACGRNRRDELVRFTMNWEETDEPRLAVFEGVRWSGNVKRWGTNRVERIHPSPVHNTPVFSTMFNSGIQPRTPFEAQGTRDDSGGAAFVKRDGAWYLAGAALAVTSFPNQPGNTSVYVRDHRMGNETYFAQLSEFKRQIEGIVFRR